MGPFDHFDKIYYINLDKRTDRKDQILAEFNKMGFNLDKVQRIPGIIHKIRPLGCSLSHLNALKDMEKNNYNRCLIFEDDFVFKQNKEQTYKLLQSFWNTNLPWDILMFSGYIKNYQPTCHKFLFKVLMAQTTSGYAVNKHFLPTLMKNYQEGIDKMEKLGKRNSQFHLDMYWKQLQPNANWYVLYPKIGSQRPGYSDIENRCVEYKVEIFDIRIKKK